MNQDKIVLAATERKIFGKANRALRKTGSIPANVYGTDFKPLAVTVPSFEFTKVYKQAGETDVVYLDVNKKEIPTLISEIQLHPFTEKILHIDFRKVNLKQKIETQVPIEITGVSEAVEKKNGVLLTQMEEIKIEALPTDIPHAITIDISILTEIGQQISVADLPKSDKYEIIDEPEKVIVSVTEHKEEELEPETVSAEPEIIGQAPKEGEEAVEGQEADAGQQAKEPEKDEKKEGK